MDKQIKNIIRRLLFILALTIIIVPARAQTVMQKLKTLSETNHFAQALEDANLNTRLNQSGPFTVFAPSNSAFDKLSARQKTNNQVLLNHIFTGMATERSLKLMSDITCLSGQTIKIQNRSGNNISVNSFTVISSNIKVNNGVIHIIDGVIK